MSAQGGVSRLVSPLPHRVRPRKIEIIQSSSRHGAAFHPEPGKPIAEPMSLKLHVIAMLAMALHAAGARADDGDAPTLLFSGFGTLGTVHSSEKNADFTSTFFKPGGAGFSHRWSN